MLIFSPPQIQLNTLLTGLCAESSGMGCEGSCPQTSQDQVTLSYKEHTASHSCNDFTLKPFPLSIVATPQVREVSLCQGD